MRLAVMCGIQAGGKSTFCRDHLFATHVRLGLDLVRTRHREDVILHACLAVGQPVVVDNTNVTVAGRARYLALGRSAGYAVELYFVDAAVDEAVRRNAGRPGAVPEVAVRGTFAKLQVPTVAEGFNRLVHVTIGSDGQFIQTEVTA